MKEYAQEIQAKLSTMRDLATLLTTLKLRMLSQS